MGGRSEIIVNFKVVKCAYAGHSKQRQQKKPFFSHWHRCLRHRHRLGDTSHVRDRGGWRGQVLGRQLQRAAGHREHGGSDEPRGCARCEESSAQCLHTCMPRLGAIRRRCARRELLQGLRHEGERVCSVFPSCVHWSCFTFRYYAQDEGRNVRIALNVHDSAGDPHCGYT